MVSPVVAQAILGLQAPDIVGSFEAGREKARQEQVKSLTSEAIAGKEGALSALRDIDPIISMKIGEMIGARSEKDISDFIQSAGVGRRMLESGQTEGALQLVNQRIAITAQRGGNTAPLQRIQGLIQTNPQAALQEMRAFEDSIDSARQLTARERDWDKYQSLIAAGKEQEATEFGRAAGFLPSRETAEEAASKVRAKKRAELEVETKLKPQLVREIKKAEAEAKSKGEAFTQVSQMKAAMPGLMDTVSQLKELANVATYTTSGKVFNAAIRELGFGATEGATARAKFIAIVNNQVLPLLKPTFGGSFTVQEGESLKATMGDPDLSPEEKIAQLDAFIAQKQRDILTQSQEAGIAPQSTVGAVTKRAATPARAAPKIEFLGFE